MSTAVVKLETMVLWCEGRDAFTDQGLVHASSQYMCLSCGTITVFDDKKGV